MAFDSQMLTFKKQDTSIKGTGREFGARHWRTGKGIWLRKRLLRSRGS